ncbi:hypothetical protein BH11PLA1_BH11PLA1_07770 [soil metagenome]
MQSTLSRCAIAAGLLLAVAGSARAGISYWDFNVFSRSTIGTSSSAYGSDFEGAAGAVGNAYFNGFTVKGVAGTSPSLSQAFYGGGSFALGGSSPNGGLEVAGTVTLTSATIVGNVRSGGNLAGTTGTVTGSATVSGSNTSFLNVNGGLTTGAAFVPTVDLAAVSSYFLAASNNAAAMAPTTGYVNNFGNLLINASGPLTVVHVSQADYTAAFGVQITGAGPVVINVAGTNLNLGFHTFNYLGGASAQSTLVNFNQATAITFTSGGVLNTLAPNAAVNFTSGVFTGNLIVGSLVGSGQVNWGGSFSGGDLLVPAPGAFAGLAALGLAAARRRRA